MKSLRTKVFWAIYGSLSLVIFISILIYNISNYFMTRNMLHDAARSVFVDPRYTNFIIQGFLNNLLTSVILLTIVLVALYFVVKKLTDWIVKPTEESFAKQKDFIADASHELKTPLSVVVASADAISPTAKNKKYLENIKVESSRMNSLIAKLLDLASTEKANENYLTSGNLSKTVELTALTFEAKALEQNRKISINVKDNIICKQNENDIKQLVEILLDNALEHSFVNSTIILNLFNEGKQIILEVINEGEGIAPGDEDKIFERFYRADKSRTGENNRYGLGLAIAKNIVENHNGKINAKSQNNKTTFKVVL